VFVGGGWGWNEVIGRGGGIESRGREKMKNANGNTCSLLLREVKKEQ
jgi:hypothetical protein